MRRALLVVLVLVAGCGGGDAAPRHGVDVRELDLHTDLVGQPLVPMALVPRTRSEGAPLLVLLHGQGSSPESLATPELVAELERLGERAPVVLLPDGGEASYWHDRETGAWARMVVEQAIPQAADRFGADPRRVAIAGVSMGGFGALHLARRHPGRFCSVAAHSPAVFAERPGRGTPFSEAFDDRRDFERNDLIEQAAGVPSGTWIDIGDADPFTPAVRRLVRGMPEPRFRVWRGGHDFAFFTRQTRAWLRFHLERC